ncbi:MAG: peptide deformylase [Deltaproteobacteria bacterium]|nr:peptide deformylase [Deltaproteobacteria bacterium]
MAILPIFEVPHPILTQVATEVSVVDDRVRRLLDDMAETMYAAPGVGLAAPQVGVKERIIVAAVPIRQGEAIEEEGDEEEGAKAFLTQLVNPVIVEREGVLVYDEGCLSVPDLVFEVERANRIVIEALDRNGEPIRFAAEGFYAVVFQHEIDHLDGITLYGRMGPLKRKLYLKKVQKQRMKDGARSKDGAPVPTAG